MENPYGPVVVKRKKCILLINFNIFVVVCGLDYKPFSYEGRWQYYYSSVLIIMYYNGFVFVFVWCPCMAINVSVQHNGGFLPGIILLTQCYYHRGGNPFKCHEEVFKEKYERI